MARLVDAEYPKYEKLFPESYQVRTVVKKESILHATRQMSAFSDPKCPGVCLEIDEQQIRISPRDPQPDERHETLAVESSTGSIRIGFDARILIEALMHIGTESLVLEFSGELDPVIVKPIDEEGHICLIMPMLLES
jgi:DNA polymerase-3 subunit beta